MPELDASLLAQLTEPAPRLPHIERWLMDDVWSASALARAGRSPKDYLLAGERQVNERESLLGATAGGVYGELAQTPVDEGLFDGIWDGFELAWRNTVQALPPDRKVLVTSDHGYVFLKSGFSDTRLKSADRPLNGKRFRFFPAEEALPANVPGLRVDEPRRLAILAGRAHNRPQGPSASQSVYRHGGLSIMEMLTPWLVLGPAGSN